MIRVLVPRVSSIVLATSLFTGCVSAARTNAPVTVSGIRFSVDTADLPSPAQGVLGGFVGFAEIASGRGRLNVVAMRRRALSVRGITLSSPTATPGDYYLFDSTGFILVRPGAKTYSTFPVARSWIHLGSARDSSEGFMDFVGIRFDTLPPASPANLRQHQSFTLRWHLDRRRSADSPVAVLARGWVEVADAPAGDASAVRFFGAAAALEALSAGTDSLLSADLQVTSAVVLNSPDRRAPLNLIVLHRLKELTRITMDASRLVLPAGFRAAPWPGFEHEIGLPPPPGVADERWRRLPGNPEAR